MNDSGNPPPDRRRAAGASLDRWAWPVALGLLALGLAGRGVVAVEAAADAQRALVESRSEVDRLAGERDRLKDELEALERDPVYLERLLRRARGAAATEEAGRAR